MVAIDKGFFKEQGLDIEYQVILNSSDRLASVDAGSSAFSNLGRSSIIPAMARGDTNFFYIYNFDDLPGIEGCWARPGVASIKDLRGKQVAANTSAEITLSGLLATQNMTEKDIDYLNLGPTEMAPALARGDVDGCVRLAAALDGLKKAAPDGKLLGPDTDTTTYQKFSPWRRPTSRSSRASWLSTSRPGAQASRSGAERCRLHDGQSGGRCEDRGALLQEDARRGAGCMKPLKFFGTKGWEEHMKLHAAQMQSLAQWLYDNKKIPSVPDVAKWENTSFMPTQ